MWDIYEVVLINFYKFVMSTFPSELDSFLTLSEQQAETPSSDYEQQVHAQVEQSPFSSHSLLKLSMRLARGDSNLRTISDRL